MGKNRPLFLPKTPTHRLRCHWHIKLIVVLSEGVISALSCLHPLLVDSFKFLLAYLLEEAMDLHDVLMAKGSLRCFKISGDRQSAAIGSRWLREAGFVGGGGGE